MANFSTHLSGSALVGTVASTSLLAGEVISGTEALMCLSIVCLGGIAPDMDADNSDALHIIFSLVALILGIAMALLTVHSLGVLASLVLLIITSVGIRFFIIVPFKEFTVHRGVMHSIPFALLSGALVCSGLYNFANLSQLQSWLFGGLFCLGYLTHLCLDEFFAIEWRAFRIKRSFGTALSLFSMKGWQWYLLIYSLLLSAFFWLPEPPAINNYWQKIEWQLLPSEEVQARWWHKIDSKPENG